LNRKEKWVKEDRMARLATPVSVLAATVMLFVYLALARADDLGAGGSMFRAVFDYGLAGNTIGAFAVRSILVYLAAFSVAWSVARWVTVKRG
jgi:hypothetical protein